MTKRKHVKRRGKSIKERIQGRKETRKDKGKGEKKERKEHMGAKGQFQAR